MAADTPNEQFIYEIRRSFGAEGPSRDCKVSRSELMKWMSAESLDVRGAVYSLITNRTFSARIEPALDFVDFCDFATAYLKDCIEHNPDGEWTDSRYLAGHQLVQWFMELRGRGESKRLSGLVEGLADLYRGGDSGVRDGIVNGLLEHLFENKGFSELFKGWHKDGELAEAYEAACLWSKR
jgi:hypothetical protein